MSRSKALCVHGSSEEGSVFLQKSSLRIFLVHANEAISLGGTPIIILSLWANHKLEELIWMKLNYVALRHRIVIGGIIRRGLLFLVTMHNLGVVNSWAGANVQKAL